MPENLFKEKIKNRTLSYKTLTELTTQFQTSLTATAIRYVKFTKEYALVYSANGLIKWCVKGKDFPFYISPGKLSEESFAIEFFKKNEMPTAFQTVPLSAWADNFSRNREIEELSIPLPYYHSVLSFLYSEEGADDEDEDVGALDGYLKFR